jgi:hypothetical protein
MEKRKRGIVLLLIVLLGCQHKKNNLYDQQPDAVVSNWNPYSSLLIGKWSQCYSQSKDGSGIMRNVCSTWIFDSNGSLWVNPEDYKKNWYVQGDTLYLNSLIPAGGSGSQITEGYKITKSEDKDLIKIELTHIEKGYMYRLLREPPYKHLSLPAFNSIKSNSKD